MLAGKYHTNTIFSNFIYYLNIFQSREGCENKEGSNQKEKLTCTSLTIEKFFLGIVLNIKYENSPKILERFIVDNWLIWIELL